jgi:hypothetical protein
MHGEYFRSWKSRQRGYFLPRGVGLGDCEGRGYQVRQNPHWPENKGSMFRKALELAGRVRSRAHRALSLVMDDCCDRNSHKMIL